MCFSKHIFAEGGQIFTTGFVLLYQFPLYHNPVKPAPLEVKLSTNI